MTNEMLFNRVVKNGERHLKLLADLQQNTDLTDLDKYNTLLALHDMVIKEQKELDDILSLDYVWEKTEWYQSCAKVKFSIAYQKFYAKLKRKLFPIKYQQVVNNNEDFTITVTIHNQAM